MPLVLVLLLLPGSALAVSLDLGTATGQVGDIVLVPLELTDLGGDSIISFEFDLTWTGTIASLTIVERTGSLTESWLVVSNIESGSATVTGAGFNPLVADGTLLWLRFQLGPSAGATYIYFGDVVLNEGDPVPTLDAGRLTATAVPSIDVTPDTGLLAVGDTMDFTTYGGTPPFSYTSSDPAIAGFSGNQLTAYAAGSVQVTSEDAFGLTNQTTGWIEIRPFRLQVENQSGIEGNTVAIPVILDNAAGYGVVSAEFELTYYDASLVFLGIETAGTLMEDAGWSTPQVIAGAGRVGIVAAGASPLSGPGPLIYLIFELAANTPLYLSAGVFNEEFSALPMDGWMTVTALPNLVINPGTTALLVGETVQFSVSGGPTLPLTWSVDDPALAFIEPSGRLRGLEEGIVQIRVEDAIGAVAYSGAISICAVGLPPINASIGASEAVLVPIHASRLLTGLDVYSLEISVSYNPSQVTFLTAMTAATPTQSWGAPTVSNEPGNLSVYLAGSTPLVGCEPALMYLIFQGAPDLSYPYTGISLSSALINEGSPCVLINRGSPCAGGSAVPVLPAAWLRLENHPNPFNPQTTMSFRTPSDGHAVLTVYTARGRRVRQLLNGFVAGGVDHEVVWDGRDETGRMQASGVYYGRLEASGASRLRKMVLLK